MENNERQQFEAMLDEAIAGYPYTKSGLAELILDLMQKAYDMPRWIACSERLPENRTYVLAFTPNGDYMSVEYKHGCFFNGLDRVYVTDWMPLFARPLPPNPSNEERK